MNGSLYYTVHITFLSSSCGTLSATFKSLLICGSEGRFDGEGKHPSPITVTGCFSAVGELRRRTSQRYTNEICVTVLRNIFTSKCECPHLTATHDLGHRDCVRFSFMVQTCQRRGARANISSVLSHM